MSFDGDKFKRPGVYYDNWDADKIQGCLCDKGWTGYDCSQRRCLWGRDPLDPATKYARNEVYRITCSADAGYFALQVFGSTTIPIPHDADPAYLKHALTQLTSLASAGDITVEMDEGRYGLPMVCGEAARPITTRISFELLPGALPPIRVLTDIAKSRAQPKSDTVLALTGGTASVLMLTLYKLGCAVCTNCHGKVYFSYGESISAGIDVSRESCYASVPAVSSLSFPSLNMTSSSSLPSLSGDRGWCCCGD
jgi:hypothetical protein